jgi:hypothetical protein
MSSADFAARRHLEILMRAGFLVLAMTMVTACSADPSKGTSASAAQTSKEGLICTTSVPTGSFVKETRCTTAQEREAARQQRGVLMDVRNERDSGVR